MNQPVTRQSHLASPQNPPEKSKTRLSEIIGPGLITGASDDDPSGIATYSQAGAQFGYGLGWTMVAHLSADVGGADDQRAHRPGDRTWHRRQPRAAIIRAGWHNR